MADPAKPLIKIIERDHGGEASPSKKQGHVVVPDTAGDRYASFQFISWWNQQLLRDASVMVVGAGALGNEVLKNLALMGIGKIFIVDFDRVEPGNLGRAVLFRAQDSGRFKADAAAQAVHEINPDVEAYPFCSDVTMDIGLGVFRRMDVIIACLDNREARLFLNSMSFHLNKPWVDGAIQELMGVARVFWPGQGACYECTLTPADWEAINLRYSCSLLNREKLLEGKIPTTPTIASIIAAIETQEALKLLHNLPVQLGKGFFYNGLNNQSYIVQYPFREDCQGHDSAYDPIIALPVQAETTTIGEMLAIVRQQLGSGAQLELDFELVTHFHCPTCMVDHPVFQPLRRLDRQTAQCPKCGLQRQALIIHTIFGDELFLDRTLASIGIPPLHILSVRSGQDYTFFQLAGDLDFVIGQTKGLLSSQE